MATSFELADSTYLQRRLTRAQEAPDLTASTRFDLARSALDDDEFDLVLSEFGRPEPNHGWGLSWGLQELLSREPKSVRTSDLRLYQENLLREGYVNPDLATPDGIWSPLWQSGSRRFEQDARREQLNGGHFLSVPTTTALKWISDTIPSRVIAGVVAMAKGLVEQTPETFERLGLLGGAGAGALVGSVLGPIGAGVGAVVGGIGGLLADLFGSDEEETGQSELWSILDPLVPNEWGNAKAFWEDLGYVSSVYGAVSGVRLGTQLVGRAVASGAAVKAANPAFSSLKASLTMVPPETPGWFARIGAQAARAIPGVTRSRAAQGLDWWRRYGLGAQVTRPLIRTINGVYTAPSAATFLSRRVAGLGAGEEETTLEAAFRRADPIADHLELLDYTAGLFVFPEKFLPTQLRTVAKTFDELVDSNVALEPFIKAVQENAVRKGLPMPGYGKAKGLAIEAMGGEDLAGIGLNHIYMQHGLDAQATFDVARNLRNVDDARHTASWMQRRGELAREVAAGNEEVRRRIISWNLHDPLDHLKGPGHVMEWMAKLGPGTALENLRGFMDASRLTARATDEIRAGRLFARSRTPFPDEVMEGLTAPTTRGLPKTKGAIDRYAKRVREGALKEAKDELKALERESPVSPQLDEVRLQRIRQLEGEIENLSTPLPEERIVTDEIRIGVERLETPLRHEYHAMQADWKRLNEAAKVARGERAPGAALDARLALDRFADDLFERGIIGEGLRRELTRAQNQSAVTRASNKIRDVLRLKGDTAPERIFFSDAGLEARLKALGYKAVGVGGEVLFPEQAARFLGMAAPQGLKSFRWFQETVGMGLKPRTQGDISAYRAASEIGELEQVVKTTEGSVSKLSGSQARRIIQEHLTDINSPAVPSDRAYAQLRPLIRQGKRWFPYKMDVRQLRPDDIVEAFTKRGYAVDDTFGQRAYGALRRGAAYGGEVNFTSPWQSAKQLGSAMRINGLPGFSDWMRTAHLVGPKPVKAAAVGAVAGGVTGIVQGDELGDILKQAAVGAAAAGGAALVNKRFAYGYLPDLLARANTAIRYTLSWTFDASRYVEQNMLGAAMHGISPMLNPQKKIMRLALNGEVKSMGILGRAGQPIGPDDAVREMHMFFDELNGVNYSELLDGIGRELFQVGVLNFSPRNFEAAQAYILAQRGWSVPKIRDAVSRIGRYGLGQAAAAKSANMIFFPFLFQKKLVTAMADFVLQAPARNLLIHEGLRRYYALGLDDKFRELVEERIPLLNELSQLNNLVYGLGPGQFFLEGIVDRKHELGTALDALTRFFVPGAVAAPLARAAGQAGDILANAFVPVVITGESIDNIGGVNNLAQVIKEYIPFLRDVEDYWNQGNDQLIALFQRKAPFAQKDAYIEELALAQKEFEPLALALGYQSVEGFLNSDVGAAFDARFDRLRADLARKYPTGAKMVSEFTNSGVIDQAALLDIRQKDQRTVAQDLILDLSEREQTWKTITESMGLPTEFRTMLVSRVIRERALRLADDPEFRALWERFFERTYGPIAVTAKG